MSTDWYDAGAGSYPGSGLLPPGQGRRFRRVLVCYAVFCGLPLFISVLSLLFSTARSYVYGSVATLAVSLGVVGILAMVC